MIQLHTHNRQYFNLNETQQVLPHSPEPIRHRHVHSFFFQRSVSTCIRTQCRVAQLPENIHEALILNSKNPLLTVWIGDKVSVSCVIVSQAEEGAAFRSSRKFFLARVFWLAARTAEENGTCVLF